MGIGENVGENVGENTGTSGYVSVESGDLVDGDNYVITGSGFGTTAPTIVAWSNMESGNDGDSVPAPIIGSWSAASNGEVDTAIKHSGTRSTQWTYSSGAQFGGLDCTLSEIHDLYYSFWFYADDNGGSDWSGQLKIHQVHGSGFDTGRSVVGNGAPGLYVGTSGDANAFMEWAVDTGAGDGQNWGSNTVFTHDAWHHLVVKARQSSVDGAADGYLKLYYDGSLTKNETSIVTRDTGNEWYYFDAIFTDGATNFTTYPTVYVDEVHCQHRFNRVELTDNATYASATKRVPQPCTSWSATSITYRVHKGELSTGTVYEVVFDTNDSIVQTTARTITVG